MVANTCENFIAYIVNPYIPLLAPHFRLACLDVVDEAAAKQLARRPLRTISGIDHDLWCRCGRGGLGLGLLLHLLTLLRRAAEVTLDVSIRRIALTIDHEVIAERQL